MECTRKASHRFLQKQDRFASNGLSAIGLLQDLEEIDCVVPRPESAWLILVGSLTFPRDDTARLHQKPGQVPRILIQSDHLEFVPSQQLLVTDISVEDGGGGDCLSDFVSQFDPLDHRTTRLTGEHYLTPSAKSVFVGGAW